MGEVPLPLHLDATVLARLEQEAKAQEITADDLAREVIERYLEIQDLERATIAQRLAEADKGEFISEEAMTRWVESWDTENELPPPEPDVFLPRRV